MIPFLLRLEWLKTRRSTAFLVCAIMYAVSFLLIIYSLSNQASNAGSLSGAVSEYLIFPGIFEMGFYSASWLTLFLLVFISIQSITGEIATKTLRQNIITGMERNEWLLGKFLAIGTIAIAAVVIVTVVLLIMGLLNGGDLQELPYGGIWTLRFFVQTLGYMVFALFVGLLVRRTGIAIFILLPYTLFLEDGLRFFIFHPRTPWHSLGKFLPVISFDNLVPSPLFKFAESAENANLMDINLDWSINIFVSLAWIALFVFLSFRLIAKRDI